MKKNYSVDDSELEDVNGGRGGTCQVKFCKFCGEPMEEKQVVGGTIYECKCGAKYDSRLAQPWSK